jgi:mono/diheme cytochrome c family protein
MLPVIACDSSQPKSAVGGATVPVELQPGESRFQAHCSACHGPQGTGTQQGPPLVHKIYEPNHHGDAAFQRAAASGVKAHHWEFGNMPKIDGYPLAAASSRHLLSYSHPSFHSSRFDIVLERFVR